MYNHDNIIKKLEKLYWKVHGLPADNDGKGNTDLVWCRGLLEDDRDSGLVPDKTEFKMANLYWKKYSNGVEPTNEDIWELIDGMLTQENPTKIGAIKMYRRFIKCTLKEAKEMVDAREIKIKKEW